MSSEPVAVKKKPPLLKIFIIAVVVGAVAVFFVHGVNARAWIDHGMTMIRDGGPWVFFLAMALTPAVGVPLSVFTLTAGPVFAPKLGMTLVVVLSLLAITINFIFTYALARRALRPWLEKLMTRLGYKLPQVAPGEMKDLAIIVRVAPGLPFFAQNYLLGLAGVPFTTYLTVSCIISWVYATAFVLFGDALIHGKGRMGLIAGSLLIVAIVITHWARKHYSKKTPPVT
jgi:uncharacterized membrane protein YdjX (TVP38/TMEM64 family)